MPIAKVPSVFVSSTCYDLRQVRVDIRSFIDSLGFHPFLSEYPSFPVDPDVSAVENCLKAVDENADIFVLIVGGRYGSTPGGVKSVTNLEYLRARAKGIPIYTFVEKSIINILPVWRANPEGDFQNIVDSPKLFEFVSSLMDSSGVWVFPFETAQDITNTLRQQLAYLFMDALQLRTRVKGVGLTEQLSRLEGPALRLVIERPLAWEYRLFAEVLKQEVSRLKILKLDLDFGMSYGKNLRFHDFEVTGWIADKAADARRIAEVSSRTLNDALQHALGPSGTPGDAESIVHVARKMAEAYRKAVEWALEFQYVEVDDEFQEIVRIASGLTSNMIKEMEEYSERVHREIEDAVNNLPPPGEKRELHLTLTLTAPDMKEFDRELNRLNRLYGIEEFDDFDDNE